MSIRYGPLSLLVIAALAVALIAGCSAEDTPGQRAENVAQAPPRVSSGIPADEPVARVASQIGPSVVQVNVRAVQETPLGRQEGEGIGSGVIYREDGYIVTNNHVVRGAEEVSVTFADGSTERGRVVGGDDRTDLAVVEVERNNLPAAKFAADDHLVPGQLAVAVGSPSGFESTVTAGVISGLDREVPPEFTGGTEEALVDLIQTDAAISPGNSGGALADREGEIVGINVAYLPQTQSGAPTAGLGFAIPSDTTISVADQLIETGEVSSPYLGVEIGTLPPEAADRFGMNVDSGALVEFVEPGSAAADAGVQERDVITALGSTEVETTGDLLGALREYSPGDTVELTVVRGGNEQTLDVTLDERPQGQ